MISIEVSRIELVEGGSVFKQGHYLTFGYIPYDESGAKVDLTEKTITVSIWGRRGIVFEGPATFSGGVLRFTLNETLPVGEYQVEFTATASAGYRKKFPANANTGVIRVEQSADDLDEMGVSIYTVAQIKNEQQQAQNSYEAVIDPQIQTLTQRVDDGVGAFTEDTEIIDARMGKINLRQFNESVDVRLTSTVYKTENIVSSVQYGIVGDGTDETAKFQQLLNENADKKIVIAYPVSKLVLGQITVPSGSDLLFAYGMTIEVKSGLLDGQKWIDFKNQKNINIFGEKVVFQMLKDEYTTGEHRHCFNLDNSENITFTGVTAKGSGGDGWYIGTPDAGEFTYCKNIRLYRCIADNNRRQGLSISSVDGFYAEDCEFNNTIGTHPECGVDIEPNSFRNTLKGVHFKRCKAIGNAGRGFDIMLKKIVAANGHVDVTIEDCYTKNNSYGYMAKYGVDGAKGQVHLIRCIAEEEKFSGFVVASHSANGVKITHQDCIAINCNTNNATSATTSFASSFHILGYPEELRATVGNVEYRNCKSKDTRSTPLIRRGFSSFKSGDCIPKKIKYVNCESEGHTVFPYEVDASAESVTIKSDEKAIIDFVSGNISPRYIGQTLTNKIATGISSINLPIAKEGFILNFEVEAPQIYKLNPQVGSRILPITAAASKAIQSNNIGATISLYGKSDGNWLVTSMLGGWVESP